MPNRYKIFFVIFLSSMLFACKNSPKTPLKKEPYFNLTQLIQGQIKLLDSIQPSVLKSIQSDKTPEVKTIKPKDWSRELYLFQEADIDKPAYRGLYRKVLIAQTGLETYQALAEKLSTKSLRIEKDAKKQLKSIIIEVKRENILYATQKTLKLIFKEIPKRGNCLEQYGIAGKQSSIFGQKTDYKILGKVQYP